MFGASLPAWIGSPSGEPDGIWADNEKKGFNEAAH